MLNRNGDIVTVQQASCESLYYDAYQPYISSIVDYVRNMVPKIKIVLHETWAYEQNSKRLNEELGYKER